MHELSIATSIHELARQRVPAGNVLRSVTIRAGPLRGIDCQAMEFAWRAATTGTDAEGAQLHLQLMPWRMRCARCGYDFSTTNPSQPCECGSTSTRPIGGDDLLLISIEVDEPAAVLGGAS
jgi:hydrogenase nickel incorporation protein HypA/HybF